MELVLCLEVVVEALALASRTSGHPRTHTAPVPAELLT